MKINWRLILQIHVYLGLFCLPYLIVFSLSSLNFNHSFLNEQPLLEEKRWTTTHSLTFQEDLEAFSHQVMDELPIFGWYSPWDSYQDSSRVHLVISQPGKTYMVDLYPSGEVEIVEKTESIENIVKLLHFIGEDIPHAPWWVNLWKHYQSLTVYSTIFWIVSGIYLWARKKKRPVIERRILWGVGILSLLYILCIWLWA